MAPVASNITREAFAAQLIFHLGGSGNSFDAAAPMVKFVTAWEAMEGQAPSHNNPLATTMRAPGSTPLPGNSAGVQILPNLDTALLLAVRNLSTPKYAELRRELVRGTPASAATALQRSPWCGGSAGCPGYGSKILALYAQYEGSHARWSAAADHPAGTVGLNTTPIAATIPGGGAAGGAGSDSGILGLDPLQGVGDATRNAVTSTADVIAALGTAAAWLADSHNWHRVGMVAGGLALALVGLALIKHDTLAQAGKAIATAAVIA